jgi:oligopeptide transport system permease protein
MATVPSEYALEQPFAVSTEYEVGERVTLWQDSWRRFRRNRFAVVGLAFTLVVVIVGLVSQFWTPYPVWRQAVGTPYQGLTLAHPLGLDQAGRDMLSRLMQGAAISMQVGLGTALLSSALGILLGLLAGFYRGVADAGISLLINVMYGVPDLLLVIMLVVIVGQSDLRFIILAISLTAWLTMARLVRGQTLSIREREFVEAARSIGTRDAGIIFRHIFPNAIGPIIVQATYLIPAAIIFEAFLSYLGLGVRPPTPSWGLMASEGYRAIQVAPHIILVPVAALSLTLLSLTAVGDGLRDALDPRMRR